MDSIKNNFSELLAAFSSEDSITILTAFLGTLLTGWIMRYFWDRWKFRSLEESIGKSEREKLHFKGQWEKLQEQHALQEADLKKSNLELADKTTLLEGAEAEKRTLNSRLNATLVDLDKSKEEFQEASSRMEDLNDQILGLRTKNAQLNSDVGNKEYEQQLADLASENTLLKGSIDELKANAGATGTTEATLLISQLEAENEKLKNQIATSSSTSEPSEEIEAYTAEITQLEAGNEALNNSMHTLLSENEDLQANADTLIQYEAGNEILNATITELLEKNEALEQALASQSNNQIEWAFNEDEAAASIEDTEELDVEAARTKFKAAIGDQIAKASIEERDDLKQINGIGPFIEEKLNDLGIYTFEQISQLDEEMILTLTSAIEFFPGRIDRDDWVGQADRLFYTKGNTPQEMDSTSRIMTSRYATATEKIEVSTAPRSAASVKPDDLKKIEGIGPKISQILNDAGIYTFANLSQTSTERLRTVLAEAGNRYKMHDPQTWPQQAALAAAGEWEKLKELQDYLDGGRDVAKG